MWYINSLQPVVGRVSVLLVKKDKGEVIEQQSLSITYYGKCALDVQPDEKTPYSAVFINGSDGTLMPLAECVAEGWEIAEWTVG